MAYATSNPPRKLMHSGIDNSQPGGIWWYNSPTDSAATVAGANYFSNGQDLGMIVGDLVIVYDVTNTIIKSYQVLSVAAAPSRAVSLSTTAGTVLGAAS